MPTHGIFPTPVGMYQLRELTEIQRAWIVSRPTLSNAKNRISEQKCVLDEEIMAPVRSQIETYLDEYFREIYTHSNSVSLRITQSWCNYAGAGEAHHRHLHPNSIVSGVYYPQTTDEDTITFYNTKIYARAFALKVSQYNEFNSLSWWMPTTQGSMILFPSELEHSVNARSSTTAPDRISLSFNTFLTGDIGDEDVVNRLVIP
tara:strand:+ start:85 stop:693 length:609 start_codon:yes stop_codon:yes gene_type:complete